MLNGFFIKLGLICSAIFALLAYIWRREKSAAEKESLKLHNEANEDAAKKNKAAAEIYSKPDVSDSALADDFDRMPD